ncbi:hypothetical protein J8273_6672 [Carpediemonas membranifera]|uniref:Uncharacterized protein n=1 Tax=Carpediemonas membranifera TaxID=201153 RepID=A0A8J6E8L4_9EUKA|nr:hypothetical protein J8273_6672 [Carpediemonas membranifera]|eukprot:KAG9392080.1 hypothetical protein J8273_6672 [Carpediemonas membranifera]
MPDVGRGDGRATAWPWGGSVVNINIYQYPREGPNLFLLVKPISSKTTPERTSWPTQRSAVFVTSTGPCRRSCPDGPVRPGCCSQVEPRMRPSGRGSTDPQVFARPR